MNNAKTSLKFLFWGSILGLSPLLLLPRGDIVIFINRHRTVLGDTMMPIITHLGSVWVYVPLVIYYFIKDRKKSYSLLFVVVLHGVITYTLKHFVFGEVSRPVRYFENTHITLDLIEGLTYHHLHSFPSGHTTTAFAIIMLLCYMYRKLWIVYLGFATAFLVGFSRIYLLQHFFGDVYAGMLIGGICATISYGCCRSFGWINSPYEVKIKK